MNIPFKKRWIPYIILSIATIVSCFYIYEIAVSNKEIITQTEIKENKLINKIDSLEYEIMVKDSIILDSISSNDSSQFEVK